VKPDTFTGEASCAAQKGKAARATKCSSAACSVTQQPNLSRMPGWQAPACPQPCSSDGKDAGSFTKAQVCHTTPSSTHKSGCCHKHTAIMTELMAV